MNTHTKQIGNLLTVSWIAFSVISFQGCNSTNSQAEEAVEQTGNSIETDANQAVANFQQERDEAVASLEEQRDKLDLE